MRALLLVVASCLFLATLAACGPQAAPSTPAPPGSGAPSETLSGNEKAGTTSSGIDVASYTVSKQLDLGGGTITLAGGPTITIAAASLTAPATVGIRAGEALPLDGGRVAVGGAYEIATSVSNLVVQSVDTPISLVFPAPLAADQDPAKLQVLARLSDGNLYPIDGGYDAAAKTYEIDIVGLPLQATYALTYLPTLLSADEPAPGRDWTRVNFSVDADGNKITLEQMKTLLTLARTAASTYSGAGFKEPFLYKDKALGGVTRWHLHLVGKDGSYFDPNTDVASAEAERHFGRLYIDVSRIAAAKTDKLGSVLSSIAHEMFHSIFHSYSVPNLCFNYTKDGKTFCYASYAGWNEGMATAVGYFIDQGRAAPRPSEDPLPLKYPPGIFSASARGGAYRNQDFMVYALRRGGLPLIRQMLEALATTSGLTGGMSNYDTLVRYHAALEGGGLAGGGFFALYATYAVDRAYIHTEDGRIWPTEGGTPFKLDSTMVGSVRDVASTDCKTLDQNAECKVTLASACPLCAYAVTLDMDKGAGVPTGVAKTAMQGAFVAKSVAPAEVTVAAFGEAGGAGSDASFETSTSGGPVALTELWSKYTDATLLLVPRGAINMSVDLTLTFTPSDLSPACQQLAYWMCRCGPGNTDMSELQCLLVAGQVCANNETTCDDACLVAAESYQSAHDDPDPTMWNEGMQCVHPR